MICTKAHVACCKFRVACGQKFACVKFLMVTVITRTHTLRVLLRSRLCCTQGSAAAVVPETKKEESNVLMVMNVPDTLMDEHVKELLSPFGGLKRFNLLKVMLMIRDE